MTLTEFLAQRPSGPLYHYTSAEGLISILERKELWASNVLHLNDAQEFRHAFGMLGTEIQSMLTAVQESSSEPSQLRVLPNEWKNPGLNTRERVAVVSFSNNGDQLSQWRAYCRDGSGYSIGFSLPDLSFARAVSSFRLVKCVYRPDEKRTLAQALLNYIVCGSDRLKRLDRANGLALLDRMGAKVVATMLAMKNEGFEEEQEWRLVGRHSDDLPLKFRAGRFGVVPYCALPLCKSSDKPTVQSVVVGPNSDPESARVALEELLYTKTADTTDLCNKVRVSSTPFRY